jgi:hypothetical protein
MTGSHGRSGTYRGSRRRRRGLPARARSGLLALCAAALFAAVAAPSGAEVGVPSFPPIPPIHVHLPKPQQRATFNVVVEGQARSTLHADTTGEPSGCLTTVQGDTKDSTRYLRGKGAHMEFDRYGNEIVVKRVGRETDSSLALVLARVLTTDGKVYINPGKVACPAEVHDLSKAADCGKTVDSSGAASLEYDTGRLILKIQNKGPAGLGGEFDDCGDDKATGELASFALAWPSPPPLEPGHLSLKGIFGRAHALAVHLRSSDTGHEQELKHEARPPFSGTLTEKAFNEATVRLVRIKS